jgi:hypothetical protein
LRRDVVSFGLQARAGGFEVLFEKGNAPSAAGSRPSTITQLAGDARTVHAEMVQYFSLRDVEAEADFVVELHGRLDAP